MRKKLCILLISLTLLCNGCSGFGLFRHSDRNQDKYAHDISEFDQDHKQEELTEEVTEVTTEEKEEEFDGTMDSLEELYDYVDKELSKGREEISFKTKAFSLDELENINEYLDGFYGNVESCSAKENLLTSSLDVTLKCKITDNYYVEQYIRKGQPIPQERTKASQMAEKCQDILEQMEEELSSDASHYKKEVWIHNYLVDTVAYGFANGDQSLDSDSHSSYGAIILHEAVCNGYAYAMKLLCDLNDIPCKLVTGTGNGESHAWNLVKLDGHWYHVDVTWDDPTPNKEGRIVYTYLNLNDDRMRASHQWEENCYPKADSLDYNYYMRNDLYCEDYDEFKEKCIDILKDSSVDHFQLMVGDYDKGVYSDDQMDFLFDYTDYTSVKYETVGEIPFMTLYISFE